MRHQRRHQTGFTLLEILMAVSILAVTLSIAIPSFATMMRTNRLAGQVNEFVTAMNYARSEAYKRGVTVRVCASNTANSDCASSSTWTNGWLVVADINNNATVTIADGDTLIQKFAAPQGGFTYAPTPSTGRFFGFRPLGTDVTTSGSASAISIYKSGCTGIETRTITLAPTGRVSLTKVSC